MTTEASLGHAMTSDEMRFLSDAIFDISRFDYNREPVFDRDFFRTTYPGFPDWVYEILELYEKGIRLKEYKQMLKKRRKREYGKALLEIRRGDFQPFTGGATASTFEMKSFN